MLKSGEYFSSGLQIWSREKKESDGDWVTCPELKKVHQFASSVSFEKLFAFKRILILNAYQIFKHNIINK